MPFTFSVIIFVQSLIFLVCYFWYRNKKPFLLKQILVSLFAGLSIGILFDIVFGFMGLFSYIPKTSQFPWGISWFQLVVNGFLSYGIFFATVFYLIPKLKSDRIYRYKKSVTSVLALLFVLAVVISVISDMYIVKLFASGIFVITLGELVLLTKSKCGIFLYTIVTRDVVPFLQLWFSCIGVGFVYEITNNFFPFWVWLPNANYSHIFIESLVGIFGYVVLFHPMMVVWQLFDGE